MASGKLTLEIVSNQIGAALAKLVVDGPSNPHVALSNLVDLLAGGASGALPLYVRSRVDDSTGLTASGSVAVTYASLAAADKLIVGLPTAQVTLTCVSTAPVAGDGTFQKVTDATATATSLKNAINTHPLLRQWVVATSSTGTVTLTALVAGSQGNSIYMNKEMANDAGMTLAGLSGGRDAGALQTRGVTVATNPIADDVLSFGAQTFTFKASAATEDQITIGADEAATAANIVTKINANTKCQGLLVAALSAPGSTLVNVTLQVGGRIGRLIDITTDSTLTLSSSSFVPVTTEAFVQGVVAFGVGMKSSQS